MDDKSVTRATACGIEEAPSHRTPGQDRKRGVLAVGLTAAASVFFLVACGSPNGISNAQNSASTTTSGGSNGTLSQAALAAVKKAVTQAKSIPKFTAPGAPVKAVAARGDKAVVFASSSEISYCANESSDLVQLGNGMGISITNFATTGQPSQWVQGALQAISTHANAFALTCGIPATTLAPQLILAKQHQVASILDQQYNISQPAPSAVTAATGIPLLNAERLIVDDAIVQQGGKPFHALVLTANDLISGPAAAAAVQAEFKKRYGSTAGVTVVNVPVSDWTTRVQSAVSSALQNDPQITAVFACFDGMVPSALPAVEAAKRPGLKIYAYGAGAGVVKLIQSTHGIVAADIGADSKWAAYVLMDEFLRVMTHQKPATPNKDYPPLRMWTPDNVNEYFAPKGGYGTAYIADFKKLWGLHG